MALLWLLIEGGFVRWVDTNSSYLVKKVLKWAFMALLRDIRDFVGTNFMCLPTHGYFSMGMQP